MQVKSLNQRNKILIIQTAFIGDVVLATSLISQLKDFNPHIEIHFLLRKGNEILLKNNPHISKVFIWDKKQKLKSLLQNIKLIRKEKYNYVFNIQRFFNSGLMTIFSGAKEKIGFDKNPLSFFFTHKVKHEIPHLTQDNYLHEVERNSQLIQKVFPEFKIKRTRPEIYFDQAQKQKVDSLIKNESKFLVMAPSSVWYTKALSPKKWTELIKNLIDYKIYIIGAPTDNDFVESLIKSQHHVTNLCGQLSLSESAYLMSKADWVFVNDSAPLHLASSVNAKTIAFFCSTIEEFGYSPLSDISHVLSVKNLECRPCGLHGHKECPLGHFKCSEDINLNKVIQIIHS
jgi:lipopolysaccharide heptosyltransferase II